MSKLTANEADTKALVRIPSNLLDKLVEIACDYANPHGENHHGLKPITRLEALRCIKEAGDISDASDAVVLANFSCTNSVEAPDNTGSRSNQLVVNYLELINKATGDCICEATDETDVIPSSLARYLEKELQKTLSSLALHRKKLRMIEDAQSQMRDPERQIICDILANAQLLPDPGGKRYRDLKLDE